MSCVLRTPETTSSPWALTRKSPDGSGRAVDLVAAERDAGARRVALVAEDHLLDVDRRPPVVGDAVDAPVGDRAIAAPRVEHRADRLLELVARLLGELLAGLVLEDLAERRGQLLQRGDVELGVERDAVLLLGVGDRVLEALAGMLRTTLPNICTKRR